MTTDDMVTVIVPRAIAKMVEDLARTFAVLVAEGRADDIKHEHQWVKATSGVLWCVRCKLDRIDVDDLDECHGTNPAAPESEGRAVPDSGVAPTEETP